MHILLIEDNRDFAEIISHILKIKGCEVDVVVDAMSGMEAARQTLPNLVFCDIGLPGQMDGLAFARAVRRNPAIADTPLVAVSGYASDTDAAKALEAGFDMALSKPVRFADLSRALETYGGRTRRMGHPSAANMPIAVDADGKGVGQIVPLRHDLAEVVFNEAIHLTASMVDICRARLDQLLTAPFSLLINQRNRYTSDASARWKLGTLDRLWALAIVAHGDHAVVDSQQFHYLLPKERLQRTREFSERQDALDWLLAEQSTISSIR